MAATEPGEVEALARQAALLRRAVHPGVAEIVSFEESAAAATLVTATPSVATLAEAPPPSAAAAAALIAALADTLGDLHGVGVAYLALSPASITVGDDGRPFLADFSKARAAMDPAVFAQDLRELAALIDTLGAPFAADRRAARQFGELAELARADELNARAVAHAAAQWAERGGPNASQSVRDAMPVGRISLILIVLGTAVALATYSGGGDSGRRPMMPTSTARSPAAPPPAPVVARKGDRFVVGVAGDRAIVGDWECQGERVALLRPSTGDVFVFDRWATVEAPVTTTAVARVKGAVDFTTRDATPCALLVVRTDSGDELVTTKGTR